MDASEGRQESANPVEGRRGRPTMTDVARMAGVSQSSVSLVLNDMTGSRISAETRARVWDAARQIGYALPAIRRKALNGVRERTTIAYLVDEISTSPHPVVNLDGARDTAFAHGVLVAAHVTRSNPELEAATVEALLRDRSVIGVIYSTIFTRRVALPPALEGVPLVLVNCYTEPRRHLSILPAEVSGGRRAAAHLISLGHTRIGFINGEPWMDAAADRLDGYAQALAAHGLPFDESLVRNGDWLPASGYAGALDLLRLPKRPTALFCGNDLMAIGAVEAANSLGLRVPVDVSILGYDDQELARYSHPPLSSLVLPNYEMGARGAQALIDTALKGKPSRARTVFVEGPLVPRLSTGPAPQGAARPSAGDGRGAVPALSASPAE
ncbi:MAG TPA: LacI family DNA-binding transcriptional regulator [Mesorhizobium sp.]|jgi:LacI family transcriptional regulator|nr:LacI family DNA-binding transcriptional regulator [Mesorhizobium sp.]